MFCILLTLLSGTAVGDSKFTTLPIPSFGAEVRGLNVEDLVDRLLGTEQREAALEEVENLRNTLHKERLLVLRQQGDIPWEKQIAFSSYFGTVFNETSHKNRKRHPAVPDDRIAIFSNDPAKGASGVGVEGWHVDGNVAPTPHGITFIHAVSAIDEGDTLFVPLREVVQSLRSMGHLRGTCVERAPPCSTRSDHHRGKNKSTPSPIPPLDDVVFQSAHVKDVLHPLIYPHPVTGQDTMIFGLGSLSGIYHQGCLQPGSPPRQTSESVSTSIDQLIENAIDQYTVLKWRWADGDLILVDNRAVAHVASPGSQSNHADVGLRLMRRTTVKSHEVPRKRPNLHTLPHECVTEGESAYCMFSLANEVEYSGVSFDTRAMARQRCKVLAPDADLAVTSDEIRNNAAGRVVSSVGKPHWLGGEDAPNGHVTWVGNVSADGWGASAPLPWHGPSGQPNDCDGPESEKCIFMGPNSRWFDFACGPKTEGVNMYNKSVTPGPEVVWEDGIKRMYQIFPLCGLVLHDGEALRLGLRMAW